jgi:hypothetical protein
MLAQVIQYQEWYRVITHGLVYQGFLHLSAVVVFLLIVGTLVEKRLGSLHFANILVIFTILIPLGHLLLEILLIYFFNDLMYQCYVGFSTVLFGIFVLEGCSAKQRWESLLGYMSLSWWIVPWLSAVLCEVVTRNHVAFLGHISGLIVGHMYTMDMLIFLKIPGNKIVMLEKAELLRFFVKLPGFVPYPCSELLPVSSHQKSNPSSKPKLLKKTSGDVPGPPAPTGQSQNQVVTSSPEGRQSEEIQSINTSSTPTPNPSANSNTSAKSSTSTIAT